MSGWQWCRSVKPTEIRQLQKDWRAAHRPATRYWDALDTAAMNAVRHQGKVFRVQPFGRVAFKVEGSYPLCKLPSVIFDSDDISGVKPHGRIDFARQFIGKV
jgi:hypothetical protein